MFKIRSLCCKSDITHLKLEWLAYRIGDHELRPLHFHTSSQLVRPQDAHARHLRCPQQLICMGFAQLTWRESLRDIEECLNAKSAAALNHFGLREPVARVTLAEAN
jgi:hypothetical protein